MYKTVKELERLSEQLEELEDKISTVDINFFNNNELRYFLGDIINRSGRILQFKYKGKWKDCIYAVNEENNVSNIIISSGNNTLKTLPKGVSISDLVNHGGFSFENNLRLLIVLFYGLSNSEFRFVIRKNFKK